MGWKANKSQTKNDSGIVVGESGKRLRFFSKPQFRKSTKRSFTILIILIVLVLVAAVIWWYFAVRQNNPSTVVDSNGVEQERTTVIAQSVEDVEKAAQKAIDDKNPEELRRVYTVAIADAADNDTKARLYITLATGLRTLGDFSGAIEAAEQSIELDTQGFYASGAENLIAYAALEVDDTEKALKYFKLFAERIENQEFREAGILEEIQEIIKKLEAGEEIDLNAPTS